MTNPARLLPPGLSANAQHFLDAFELSDVPKVLSTTRGQCVAANAAFCALLGYDRAEITQGSFVDLTHPDDVAASLAVLDSLLSGARRACRLEKRYLHKDGHSVWTVLSVVLLRDAGGRPLYTLAEVVDITQRKQAEGQLLDAMELLNQSQELARVGGWELDLASGGLSWTDSAFGILDLESGPVQPDRFASLACYGPEGRPAVEEAVRLSTGQGGPFDLELEMLTARSRRIWVRTRGRAVFRGGRAVKVVGALRDITEEKQREQALKDALRRLNLVLSSVDDLVWFTSTDGTRTLSVNGSYERVYGIPVQAFMDDPRAWLKRVHPEDHLVAEQSSRELRSRGRAEAEYRIIRPDGTVRWLRDRKTVFRDEAGLPLERGGILSDITEIKESQQMVLVQRDLGQWLNQTDELQAGLERCLEAAMQLSGSDVGGVYQFRAEGWLELTAQRGYTADNLAHASRFPAGSPPFMYVAQGRSQYSLELADRALAEQTRREGLLDLNAIPLLQGDRVLGCIFLGMHEVRAIPFRLRPALEAIGAQAGAFLARMEAQAQLANRLAELARARDAAEAATKAKSAFLANMSHEIRTPLNAVLGFTQLLLRDRGLTERQEGYLRTINQAGDHLLSLINDVLDLSRIEAGRSSLVLQPFDLHQLVEDLAALFRPRADAKGLAMEYRLGPELPRWLLGDAPKLRQVLMNLLGNAVKFTAAGRVTLEAEVERLEPRCQVRLRVRDTGPGVACEDQERIFAAFEQGGEAAAQGGSGLGLAICRQFARIMDGRLELESEPGRGSCFSLVLELKPCEPVPALAGPQARFQLPPEAPERRVLIVDDRADNRALLRELLDREGFAIREAAGGLEAIALVEAWNPWAILMDLQMPGLDGLETIRRLRAAETGRRTRIIAVSASALDFNQREAMEAGADAFLAKPFREAQLFRLLSGQLGLDGQEGPAAGGPGPAAPEPAAGLAQDLVRKLRQAAALADIGQLQALQAALASARHPAAAEVGDLLERFDYPALIRLLDALEAPPG